jgi:hypothetical protein
MTRFWQYSPRRILRSFVAAPDANPENVVAQSRDLLVQFAVSDRDSVGKRNDAARGRLRRLGPESYTQKRHNNSDTKTARTHYGSRYDNVDAFWRR